MLKSIEYVYHGWYNHLEYIEKFVNNYPQPSPTDKMTFMWTGKSDETRPTRSVSDDLRKEYSELTDRVRIFLSSQDEDLSINNREFANTLRILDKHDRPRQEENIWWGLSGVLTCAASAINLWNYKEMTTNPELSEALKQTIPEKTVPSLKPLVAFVRAQLIKGPQTSTVKDWIESLDITVPEEIQSTIDSFILPMLVHTLILFARNEKKQRTEFRARAEEIIKFSKHFPHSGRIKWLSDYYENDFPKEDKKINKWHAIKFGSEAFRAFTPNSIFGNPMFWIVKGRLVRLLSGNKINDFNEILKEEGYDKPISPDEYTAAIQRYISIQ